MIKDVPVIMLTSHADKEMIQASVESGASDYVVDSSEANLDGLKSVRVRAKMSSYATSTFCLTLTFLLGFGSFRAPPLNRQPLGKVLQFQWCVLPLSKYVNKLWGKGVLALATNTSLWTIPCLVMY
ncbi:TPA: response regulator [Vibrio vulnificus]|nr:hypothetical protein [Vibrio vulnificus]HDY7460110.1 response regulator [Vibrio vulnificus]HDY7574435.1 response regulator [Vibrio vulnificus]HDY7892927.1 response regulator [Vibrio vulnificus]HDY8210024.1 response regulator [Vibrio vulnificus]